MTLRPRLLIVEDMPMTRESLTRLFRAPTREFAAAYGYEGFDVVAVATGLAARTALEDARSNMQPYDVMCLDLRLPETVGDIDRNEKIETGLRVLRSLGPFDPPVVVMSQHADFPTCRDVMQIWPVDFIPKPFEEEHLFRAVVQAFETGRERRAKAFEALRARRMEHWLLAQSCAQLADQMGQAVTTGLGDVLDLVGQLEALLEDHYQLVQEPEREDPVRRQIAALKKAVHDTVQQCAKVRTPFSLASGERTKLVAQREIADVLEALMALLVHRRTKLDGPSAGETSVVTFPTLLHFILEEMVFGGVCNGAEGSVLRIRVSQDNAKNTVGIEVVDQAPPLSDAERKKIADGDLVTLESGRARGLSLAQRVALNIGGYLVIARCETGNAVTLHLPVITHE